MNLNTFRVHTEDRLTYIERDVLALQALHSPAKVISQIGRFDQKTFSQSLPALRTAAEHARAEVDISSSTLQTVSQKLLKADQASPDYWPTVLQFIQFATAGYNPNVPPPGEPNVTFTNSHVKIPLTGNRPITYLRVVLDGGDIKDNSFKNCRIRFTNNPVHMERVSFIDCVFEMPVVDNPSPSLKQASRELLASNFTYVSSINL